MNSRFFDVHTHVQFAVFKIDSREVISRALGNNVWMINVGTQKDTSLAAINLAKNYDDGVYATVGLHPIHTEASFHDVKELGDGVVAQAFTSRGEEFDYEYYKNLSLDPKVVAIGECGLDYYRLTVDTKEKQKEILMRQIALAGEVKKPLMIHCREAFANLIGIFKENKAMLSPRNPGVIHFFSGTKEDAKKLLDLGFSFSFGGVLTFARDYDEVVKYTPLDRILLETDAPYVAPVPYRGKRNEPSYVIEVAKKISELKGVNFNKVASETTKNAERIFLEKNHEKS